MRTFFISQLTRLLDFLKASEPADSDSITPSTVPEKINFTITPPVLANGDDIVPTEPAAFFPDKPSVQDYLDFHSYAATLADLIDTTQTPLTVGVFGAWGSGKTTLMRMIESALRDTEKSSEAKRFMLVRFEAWKYYKEDALWRAMLLQVLDALRPNVEGKSKLKESIDALEQSLYRDVEWKEKGGLTIDWPKLAKAGASGALKLSFAFVPGVSTLVEAVKAAQGAIGKGDVAGDVSSIAEAFRRDMIVHHRTQLSSIEQFQNEFSKLVNTHFAKQRLVIFVDDLDRCLPEKAIEVLEAIKLFLDVEGCVFVLGIDQDVITRGLEARYKEIVADGQAPKFSAHYIEKLIQLPFHLPPIEAREIGSYLKLLNVDWPHAGCADVFSEALSPNPRQIKRTINVFMLLWKLAERRRSSLGEAVTALRLAKVVVLQTAYPEVFEHLKSDGRLLRQLELLSRDTATEEDLDPVLLEAVQKTSLKKLFQLIPEEESASFANLELDELTAFFSLARRAPFVNENVAKETVVTAPVLPTMFVQEPVTPSVERPFQLRAPVADFVGRSQQLSQMLTALRKDASVGVVTGMAGVGKTEFALLVAESLHQDYPDGQLFVDLQGTAEKPRESAEALSICIRAFEGRERDLPTEVELLGKIYRSHLNGKRVLIMLDNASDPAQVQPLMPPKGSVLLVTSRSAFVLPGMTSITLDQLSPAESMMLFRSISQKGQPEIAAEICSLCGYLPLTIRAAASILAATPDLDPAVYAKQLRDEQKRIELLGDEGVNVSLETSLSLSYSRLREDAKKVFRKLSVFPETFDAYAAEIICEDPSHAHLSYLVKLSLVYYDSTDRRYRVHPLIRLFAQRHLTPAESEDIEFGHASYYLQEVREAGALYRQGGESSIQGLSLFDLERANIDAGFQWFASRSSTRLDAASGCSDYARHAAEILEMESSRVRSQWFEPALAAARKLGDVNAELGHLLNLGAAQRKSRELDSAIDIFTEALDVAERSGLQDRKAEILSGLGLLHRDRGEILKAIECFEEQLAISRELRNLRMTGIALVNIANANLAMGEIRSAIDNYEKAINVSRKVGDVKMQAMALGNLGRAYNMHGDPDRALSFYREQLEISSKLGDRLDEATAHFNSSVALQQKGDLEQARAEATIALQIFQQIESPNASTVLDWLAKLSPGPTSTDHETDGT